MKKVFSLLLAVLLTLGMTSMAFAAVGPDGGNQYTLGTSGRINDATKGNRLSSTETLVPGDKIYIPVLNADGTQVTRKASLSNDKVTVTVKHKKNSNLFEKPSFETVGGAVYVKLEVKSSFVSTKTADVDFTVSLAYKGKAGTDTGDFIYYAGQIENNTSEIIDEDGGTYYAEDHTVFEVDSNFSGKVTFDFGSSILFKDVRVFSKQKFYLELSRKANSNIYDKYGDKADLDFYNFVGSKDNFSSTGTLSIPSENKVYLYKIVGSDLVELNYTYNYSDEAIEFKTRNLESYVISDVKLDISKDAQVVDDGSSNNNNNSGGSSDNYEGNNNDNPQTGVNGMMSIAVSAGLVALAVAGAVVLKK